MEHSLLAFQEHRETIIETIKTLETLRGAA
jgi:hypothetical protein